MADRAMDFVAVVNDLRARMARMEALAAARLSQPASVGWGYIGSASLTATSGAVGTTQTVVLSCPVTTVAGRRYRVTGCASVQEVTAGATTLNVALLRGGTQLQNVFGSPASGSAFMFFAPVIVDTPGAGSFTYQLAVSTFGGGTMTANGSATAPVFILVEDIGPA